MDDNTILKLAGIAGVVILEGIALCSGVDGTLLAGATAVVAGLAGYFVGKETK